MGLVIPVRDVGMEVLVRGVGVRVAVVVSIPMRVAVVVVGGTISMVVHVRSVVMHIVVVGVIIVSVAVVCMIVVIGMVVVGVLVGRDNVCVPRTVAGWTVNVRQFGTIVRSVARFCLTRWRMRDPAWTKERTRDGPEFVIVTHTKTPLVAGLRLDRSTAVAHVAARSHSALTTRAHNQVD
ncbi:MAG: hypothetical protein IPJ34_33665 [Myxococcales bacterium]|nr:hypothetical protein [Myxococcales bacterium]